MNFDDYRNIDYGNTGISKFNEMRLEIVAILDDEIEELKTNLSLNENRQFANNISMLSEKVSILMNLNSVENSDEITSDEEIESLLKRAEEATKVIGISEALSFNESEACYDSSDSVDSELSDDDLNF